MPAFDPVESDDEYDDAVPQGGASVVPVGTVVEPDVSAGHSGRFAALATAVDASHPGPVHARVGEGQLE